MLLDPNHNKLGDKRLSKEEALKRAFEDTDRQLQRYRLADQEDLANAEKRLGHPMTSNELIRRVTKINPNLWAEDSIAAPTEVTGFYTARDKKKIFCVAFEKGWLPEFSIIVEDRAGLPVKERRGWRTVLVRLIHGHYLTYSQVVEAFGDALGINAKNWHSLTQGHK